MTPCTTRRTLHAAGQLAVLLLVLVAPRPAAASPATVLEDALREYRSALDCPQRDERLQRFRRAELLFSQLAAGHQPNGNRSSGGIRNAELYCHLGNAALGAEQLGTAILAYRRALLIDPDHRRAVQNLRHVRTLLPEWVPRPEEGGLLDTFLSWKSRLSHPERQAAAAGLFLVAASLLAASLRWQRPALRHLAWIPAIAWLFLVGTLLIDLRSPTTRAAVVTLPEVVGRAADSIHAPPRFSQPLPSGAEVEVTERRNEWLHIRLFDGRDAWVPSDAVEMVSVE